MLDPARIAALLQPFLQEAAIPSNLFGQLHTHLDLLLRWNARMNLTAVRDPEQIVTRHFGESLFAARLLREAGALDGCPTVSDIGSGAGFPGLPLKLFDPAVHLTLIESQNKKVAFLREVIRALQLENAEVFYGRAETWGKSARVVTLRAVEKFDAVLPTASALVEPGGTLCLLIGEGQAATASAALGEGWSAPQSHAIPSSGGRIIWIPTKL